MGFQLEKKVSIGHLISAATVVVVGILGYADLRSTQGSHTRWLERMESAQQEREVRLRALEISVSAQASDLRNIQNGITDIKTSLDKLMAR